MVKTSKRKPKQKKTVKSSSNSSRGVAKHPFHLTHFADTVCPESVTVTLKFQYSANFITDVYNYSVFSMNSVYDPLYTAGGGSCTGYLTWASLYDRYYVSRTTVEAFFMNRSDSAAVGHQVLAYILPFTSAQAAAGSAIVVTPDLVSESARCTSVLLPPNLGASNSSGRLTQSYDVSNFEGNPSVSANWLGLSGRVGADPTSEGCINVGFVACDGTTATCSIEMFVVVTYRVRFYARLVFGTA